MERNIKKPVVLHITYELRRRKKEEVTSAVRDLINGSKQFSLPYIVSLLRVPNLFEVGVQLSEPNTLDVNAYGWPYGILLRHHLNCALKLINKASGQLNIEKLPIDVIHAHKLTFEGYIGYKIAKKRKIPLIITLRQTDFSVMKHKPSYRALYREIIEYSSKIICLVPYMMQDFRKFWRDDYFENHVEKKFVFLPNIVDKKIQPSLREFESGSLLTIVRMTKESVQRKNIKYLLRTLKNIGDKSQKLRVIGDGPYLGKVKQWVVKFQLQDQVEFLGRVDNKIIDSFYQQAEAFVLPSKSESFGMVYAESLMNGTPILYSKNTGFDGLFEKVGIAVNPYDLLSIQNGLRKIIAENKFYRDQIKKLQGDGAFAIFQPENVREKYQQILNQTITGEENG